MENDFNEFVAKRCEKAVMENKAYVEKEQCENVDEVELQTIVESLCYKKGFFDAIKMLKM